MAESPQRTLFQPFREWPLKHKLMFIILVTTTSALLAAGAGIIVSDSFLFYGYLERDLTALSRIVADNTTAALAFDDPNSATETLNALRARPHVVSACVYRTDETVLAQYKRDGVTGPCPAPAMNASFQARDGLIVVSQPIVLQNRPIGSLRLQYDLGELWGRIRLFGLTVLFLVLLSMGIAVVLSSKLRAIVVTPVCDLVETATSVSKTKDYSMRAEKHSPDELGLLADAFNDMLSGIQSRDNDLTKALAEVQDTNQKLARSNEDLERFAFIASHDLQEPLRMITAYSQLLVKQYPQGLDGSGATFVSNIVGGTARMRALLSDLLAYTEINANPDLPIESVDLNQVIDKVLSNLKVTIDETHATVKVDPLPVVRAYEAHMAPLFQNLIGNALKYRSGENPKVRIFVEHLDGQLCLAVADNGIGIDPEYHAKIFVAFKRLHAQHSIPGTGIGLAICQRVVERYGGRIWVESIPGAGSTFRFTLPVAAEEAAKAKDASQS
jgi:signal transduction histidine kinase